MMLNNIHKFWIQNRNDIAEWGVIFFVTILLTFSAIYVTNEKKSLEIKIANLEKLLAECQSKGTNAVEIMNRDKQTRRIMCGK